MVYVLGSVENRFELIVSAHPYNASTLTRHATPCIERVLNNEMKNDRPDGLSHSFA